MHDSINFGCVVSGQRLCVKMENVSNKDFVYKLLLFNASMQSDSFMPIL